MLEAIRRTLLAVGIIAQVILFLLQLRAGWTKDRRKQLLLGAWVSAVMFVVVLLLFLNPTNGNGSRLVFGCVLLLSALSTLLSTRHLKTRSRSNFT
jgi:hypothetical protein